MRARLMSGNQRNVQESRSNDGSCLLKFCSNGKKCMRKNFSKTLKKTSMKSDENEQFGSLKDFKESSLSLCTKQAEMKIDSECVNCLS